ncbi:MAG TPA: GNAT family N-acetyltransferase [Candidatus Faecousia gallistercoris]|nr:GNAT family N-acetyltransferase [Candidatus Faecousia gallistercoris]
MVYQAGTADLDALATLAALLWDSHSVPELRKEFAAVIEGGDGAFFLKTHGGAPVGFAQCQLRRDYVEGTRSSPVGYLEGIFVREAYRRRGFAGELLAACEGWARSRGCTEFASDCELSNACSLAFHLCAGFSETNRIICFAKKV